MGILDLFKKNKNGRFATEQWYKENSIKQVQLAPQVLEQLRNIDVTEDKELKLEFFFYTNTNEKAAQLSESLKNLNYSVQYSQSGNNKKLIVITGWTTKIRMEDVVVKQWVKHMCDLGHEFDCEFDGWGTTPDQDKIP